MKDKIIKFIAIAFLLGVIIGLGLRMYEQHKEIDELTNRLYDTQEQLIISNDQLKQIQMYQEREQYMGSDKE